jgi:hypothetical protein
MDERAGEIRVVRDAVRYPVVHLTRLQARHLAALILMQAERIA